jgi:hypothetical protein
MGRLRALTATLLAAAAVALAAASCGGGDGDRAPVPATVLWAIGDGGTTGEPPRQVSALVAGERPEAILYLGDVYEQGTSEEYQDNFAAVYGDLVKRMWPTPGNHDWPNREQGYDRFWERVRGEPLPHFYAREAGGWQVLSVNSEDADDSGQLDWLREQASGGGDCRLMFMHRPRFTAGRHEDEQERVAELWDAVKGRAAIVVSAHDHNLQRFRPVDGTVQYISGAGGDERYEVDDDDPRLAFSEDDAFGALRIELRPGTAELTFVSADGTELDRSTVTCGRD